MPVPAEAESHVHQHRTTRRHPRHMFSVPIRLRHLRPEGIETTRGVTLDISEGGLGAVVEADLYSGETVEIALPLCATPLHAVAIVRYVGETRSGFEFLGLTPAERQQIAAVTTA